MKLQKRNKVWHIIYRSNNGNISSVSTHCKREEDAALFMQKWITNGSPTNQIKYVNDVLDYYYINHGIFSPTQRRINIAINWLKPFFKDTLLCDLNNSQVTQYRLKRNRANSTIRYELNQIRTAINYCIAEKKLLPQQKVFFKLPPKSKGDNYVFDYSDIEKLMDRFKKVPHIILFFWIALFTGARKNHILNLKWIYVDFPNKLIDFSKSDRIGTTKKGAIVKMNDKLYEILLEAHKNKKNNPYVINYAGKKVVHLAGMQEYKREQLEPKYMTKTFRHTAATWAANEGVPMSEIASMLGHTEAETTKIYAHIHPDYQKGAVKALSDKYRRGKNEAKHFLSHLERKNLAEDKEEKA